MQMTSMQPSCSSIAYIVLSVVQFSSLPPKSWPQVHADDIGAALIFLQCHADSFAVNQARAAAMAAASGALMNSTSGNRAGAGSDQAEASAKLQAGGVDWATFRSVSLGCCSGKAGLFRVAGDSKANKMLSCLSLTTLLYYTGAAWH
jgi:hypothetical protein